MGAVKANIKAESDATYEPLKGEDDNYVTDADIVKLGNLSGTNTGDQDLSALQPKTITPISGMTATTVEEGLEELKTKKAEHGYTSDQKTLFSVEMGIGMSVDYDAFLYKSIVI